MIVKIFYSYKISNFLSDLILQSLYEISLNKFSVFYRKNGEVIEISDIICINNNITCCMKRRHQLLWVKHKKISFNNTCVHIFLNEYGDNGL